MQLPQLSDLTAAARVIKIPLVAPFRGLTVKEFVVFEGPSGWGEFAPFKDHTLEHSAQWLHAAIESAYGTFPEARRNSIAANAIVPDISAQEMNQWVSQTCRDLGVSVFKIKCGATDFDVDHKRISALIEAAIAQCGSQVRIRLDANGRWSIDDAIFNINRLSDEFGDVFDYVEQPTAALADCAYIKSRISMPIAIDEGIRLVAQDQLPADAIREAGDVAILKAIPLGGVARALEIAERLAMPVVVSGSLDTAIGLQQGIALACALPELDLACGLGTGQLLQRDVVSPILVPRNGELHNSHQNPDVNLLEELSREVAQEERDYWFARMSACYEILENQ